MTIANTILQQLGGGGFLAMTGAKNLVADGYTLRMTLPKNHSKANRLEITLNGLDLYDMRFYRYTAPRWVTRNGECRTYPEKVTEVKTYNDVYCDQLQELFTEVTWMYTHL